MITFILLGTEITRVPKLGTLMQVERSAPTHAALYERRLSAARAVETEYFSILDGGGDILLDKFETATQELCDILTQTGLDIGSTREQVNGHPGHFMHHNVVCRTSAFKKLKLPESGTYMFETLVYTPLSKPGVVKHDVVAYNWIPTPGGAATWADCAGSYANSMGWLTGKPPIHTV